MTADHTDTMQTGLLTQASSGQQLSGQFLGNVAVGNEKKENYRSLYDEFSGLEVIEIDE